MQNGEEKNHFGMYSVPFVMREIVVKYVRRISLTILVSNVREGNRLEMSPSEGICNLWTNE